MTLLILFFLLSIIASFLCSVWEAVLLSVTPSYVNTKIHQGRDIGHTLEVFKKDIDKPLSAILTLNTIAHTVGAIGVGIQATKIFDQNDLNLFGLSVSMESIVAGLMTLAILVLSEIIPKTIGANYWQVLTPFTVKSLQVLMFVLLPFVWMSQIITKSLKKQGVQSVFSRADLVAMASVVENAGDIHETESNVIKNLLSLDDLTVHDIMTPRSVILMANESQTLQSFYDNNKPFRFSRIPIYKIATDNIIGFFLKDDLLQNMLDGKAKEALSILRRDITMVHENKKLSDVLKLLTAQKSHLSIAVDDYGSVVGLITMEDVLETVLGIEITDESDAIADLQAYARKRWEERAKNMGLLE
jgi:CBS domain containing-hemolysin-like protein